MEMLGIISAVLIAVISAGFIMLELKVTDFVNVSQQGLQTELIRLQKRLSTQEEMFKNLTNELKEGRQGQDYSAVTYIRWGRRDCPTNDTELVYTGYAGGSHHNHSGGAAEYICLPSEPSWGSQQNLRKFAPGYIYGVEYRDGQLFGLPDRKGEAPCVVCCNSGYSTLLMIPARTQCYPGWKEAYHGYLASGYFNHKSASQYVCVDEHPQEVTEANSTMDDGKLFYQVRTRCVSLKCPPYENDKVLSCVVCMK